MALLKDITGNKYNMLLVKGVAGKSPSGRYKWECLCDCGKTVVVTGDNIKNGHTRSCGCIGRGSHNLSYSPEYSIWNAMKSRCLYPKNKKYKDYGGRGIKVSPEWFDNFQAFYDDMGPRPTDKHTIERVDVNGNYCKENCIWTDDLNLQSYNQRKSKNNKSGRTGVRRNRGKRWLADIGVDYKAIFLGCYETFEEAVAAREAAELKYYGFIKE